MTTTYQPNLQRWFDWMKGDKTAEGLSDLLHDDVVFRSPVVHTPKRART